MNEGTAVIAHDVPSAMTDAELVRLGELARGRVILELGSYYGRSTITMASVAQRVHSVDPHFPDQEGHGYVSTAIPFVENLIRYGVRQRVVAHLGSSEEVVPLLPAGFFDLVFVDAAHQREHVEKDLALVRRVVKQEGVLAFHDYGPSGVEGPRGWEPFGVTEVVDELAAETGSSLEVIDTLAVVRLSSAGDSPAGLRGVDA